MKPSKLPRYTHGYVDRHGTPRFYFRKAGQKTVPLPGLPWSPQFMEVYERALREVAGVELGAKRTVPGTISAALVSYYQSSAFTEALAKVTQQNRRAILKRSAQSTVTSAWH
jgi:hypothetical protein